VYPVVKKFMVILAVLMVGAVQLFGARIGYLCACTGDFSQVAACQPAMCHATDDHPEVVARASVSQDSAPPCGERHQHSEVRDTQPMTSALAGQSIPAPVFFELPEMFQVCGFEDIEGDESGRCAFRRPADDRSPPAALLVAGTVVLMV
jgi:hypothetical protein